jgi:hypothetical protein
LRRRRSGIVVPRDTTFVNAAMPVHAPSVWHRCGVKITWNAETAEKSAMVLSCARSNHHRSSAGRDAKEVVKRPAHDYEVFTVVSNR